jgi:hypothetical protein
VVRAIRRIVGLRDGAPFPRCLSKRSVAPSVNQAVAYLKPRSGLDILQTSDLSGSSADGGGTRFLRRLIWSRWQGTYGVKPKKAAGPGATPDPIGGPGARTGELTRSRSAERLMGGDGAGGRMMIGGWIPMGAIWVPAAAARLTSISIPGASSQAARATVLKFRHCSS